MGTNLNYYDAHQPGPIAPAAQIRQNVSIWTQQVWEHYNIDFIEGMPLGSQSIIDMVNAAGVTTIAANGTLAKRVITQLRVNMNEMLHLRWHPIEALEGILWEQPNKSRNESRALASRVDFRSGEQDPHYAATTFFILGIGQGDRDFNLEVRNPQGFAYPMARFQFWGYRYILKPIDLSRLNATDKTAMKNGDPETIKRVLGATTFIIAEGKQA